MSFRQLASASMEARDYWYIASPTSCPKVLAFVFWHTRRPAGRIVIASIIDRGRTATSGRHSLQRMLTQPERGTIDMARHCFREDDFVSQFLLERFDAASLIDGNSCPKRMPQVAMGQIRRRAIVQSFNPSNAHQA